MEKIFADKDTEYSVLTSAIFNRMVYLDVMELKVDDFYYDHHKKIFRALKLLGESQSEISLVNLHAKLYEMGMDIDLINTIVAGMGLSHTTFNAKYVMNLLQKLSQRRKIDSAIKNTKESLKNLQISNDDILSDFHKQIDYNIKESDFKTFIDIGKDNLEIMNTGETSYKTHINELDKKLIGLYPGEFTIIAARPSLGKTTLALQIACDMAKDMDVLFISLEMSSRSLGLKIISRETGIDSQRIRSGQTTLEEVETITKAVVTKLPKLKITFLNNAYSLESVLSRTRKFAMMKDVKAVFIDYLQLMEVRTVKETRNVQVGEISRQLKKLAEEMNIVVVAMAQLNRNAEGSSPVLSDLRESGNIEQDADVIMFISNPKNTDGENNMTGRGGPVIIDIAKNRNGNTGWSKLYFDKIHSRFTELANEGI